MKEGPALAGLAVAAGKPSGGSRCAGPAAASAGPGSVLRQARARRDLQARPRGRRSTHTCWPDLGSGPLTHRYRYGKCYRKREDAASGQDQALFTKNRNDLETPRAPRPTREDRTVTGCWRSNQRPAPPGCRQALPRVSSDLTSTPAATPVKRGLLHFLEGTRKGKLNAVPLHWFCGQITECDGATWKAQTEARRSTAAWPWHLFQNRHRRLDVHFVSLCFQHFSSFLW